MLGMVPMSLPCVPRYFWVRYRSHISTHLVLVLELLVGVTSSKKPKAPSFQIYEGRSINKLQNGAIPPVLKIGKIRNIRFVGNLILNIRTEHTY